MSMMTPLLFAVSVASSAALAVAPRYVPTAFWLLQAGSQDMQDDVALCTRCCESADEAALEASLAALTATGRVAVEISPVTLPGDPPPPPSPTADENSEPVFFGDEYAEEITSLGPRSFLLPGNILARVHEFDFKDGGTGSRVWDAAIAMSVWLARRSESLRGKSVLELGAGTGLCGISAALAAGVEVTLSDMAPVAESTRSSAELAGGSAAAVLSTSALLPNLEANARLNGLPAQASSADAEVVVAGSGAARAVALDWEACSGRGVEQPPEDLYDVVIGSDVVYEGFAVTALAEAILAHTRPGGVAHLMSASSRFEGASVPLLVMLKAQGTVELEKFTVHNSFGNTELVLTTWRRRA